MKVKTTAIVSIVTGRLICPISNLYDAFEILCHERPQTVQMIRFKKEVTPYLEDQIEWLAKFDVSGVCDKVTAELCANDLVTRYGEYQDIEPMSIDDHDFLPVELDIYAINPSIESSNSDDFFNDEEI